MPSSGPLFKRWIPLIDAARIQPGPFDCPQCGAHAVWAVFVGDPKTRIGAGWIWCDACLHCIEISRMQVPESAHPFSSDASQWPRQVPNFKRVNGR